MQKTDHVEQTLVTQYMTTQESVVSEHWSHDCIAGHMTPLQPPRPFEVILLWEAGQVAEQLCLIESDIFCRVSRE